MFQQLLVPIATFIAGAILGVFVGWFAHKHFSKQEMDNWERGVITIVVTFAWVLSVILDIVLQTYETPVPVHAVMGLVVGYFFEGSLKDVFTKK